MEDGRDTWRVQSEGRRENNRSLKRTGWNETHKNLSLCRVTQHDKCAWREEVTCEVYCSHTMTNYAKQFLMGIMVHLAHWSQLFCGLANEHVLWMCQKMLWPTHPVGSSFPHPSSPLKEIGSWTCPSNPYSSFSSSPEQPIVPKWKRCSVSP